MIKSKQQLRLIRVNYIDQAIPIDRFAKAKHAQKTSIEDKETRPSTSSKYDGSREMAWNAEGMTTKEMNMKKDEEREMDIYLVVAEN